MEMPPQRLDEDLPRQPCLSHGKDSSGRSPDTPYLFSWLSAPLKDPKSREAGLPVHRAICI